MPGTEADLETSYTAGEVTDVATDDAVRVCQTATGQYAIHLFKNYIGASSTVSVLWNGQSSIAPSSEKVVLQVYNFDDSQWDDLDEENAAAANTDFNLTSAVDPAANYRDGSGVMVCRVYQQMP